MPKTDARLAVQGDARVARVFAPAKINLSLHIIGQRSDGYHLLDSLVAFADVGDLLEVRLAAGFSLETSGAEAAAVPADGANLILRVARMFDGVAGAAFALRKDLPVAAGIGGGSADAAAAHRALSALTEAPVDIASDQSDLMELGADIPMCLDSDVARVGGIGEVITPAGPLPPLAAVLVNPRTPLSTPSVFSALKQRDNPPMAAHLPEFNTSADVIDWLTMQRNDLEAAAIAIEPAIAQVKAVITQQDGCGLARMSGSGATCFGLFPDAAKARRAADEIALAHPEWWVQSVTLGSQSGRARPQIS